MARNGIICSILVVYFMVVMPTTGQYCPKDSNPIIEDQTNCTFEIHNDTTAVQNILKMVASWNDELIQNINIPIIISGNDTELTSHHRIRLHEWVMRNIDPDRPPHFISWRTDFKILSFGLLSEKGDLNPEFTLAIDETEGACTFQYGSESTTREIVRTVLNYIRESKLLDERYEFENINMCFLSVYGWFKNSPWYIMKRYLGVPFQQFGNRCCKLYKQTVCCNDQLYNINGDRLIPYIISVILICYVPLILLQVTKINHTLLHLNKYYDFDNISDNGSQLTPSLMSIFDNIFCINTQSNEFTKWLQSRIGRILFVFLLPCGIYLEFIMFSLSKDWKAKIEDIDAENVLFGFTPILVNITTNTFLYPIGPFGFLVIYHLIGIIILVLPENFEENVIKKGILPKIRNTIFEELNQPGYKNLPGYMELERVLTTCMFLVFNCKYWCSRNKTSVILFFVLPFLALPVIPFTIIIFIGYADFVMSKLYCKCACTSTMNGNIQPIDADQIQVEVVSAKQTPAIDVKSNIKPIDADQIQVEVVSAKQTPAIDVKSNIQPIDADQIQVEVVSAKQTPAIDVNSKNIGAEQNETTDENTRDTGADNNTTFECHRTCKTIMKVVYGFCSLLLMTLFLYLLAVIVSYTVFFIVYVFYFILWALVTSHTETSSFLIFFSGGILFLCNIVKGSFSYYIELFKLTIEVCQQNEDCSNNGCIKLQNGIIYINKDIVRTIQRAIYPFYNCIGYTIMQLIAVGLLYYMIYVLVIRTGEHAILTNVTVLITSALPTLVASQFQHKPPNKEIVNHIVLRFLKENVNVEIGGQLNVIERMSFNTG